MTDRLSIFLLVHDLIGEEMENQDAHSCPVCAAVVEKLRLVQLREQEGIIEQSREEYGIV